jgi:hypothetical protein
MHQKQIIRMSQSFNLSIKHVLNDDKKPSCMLSFNFILPADPTLITEEQRNGIVAMRKWMYLA